MRRQIRVGLGAEKMLAVMIVNRGTQIGVSRGDAPSLGCSLVREPFMQRPLFAPDAAPLGQDSMRARIRSMSLMSIPVAT